MVGGLGGVQHLVAWSTVGYTAGGGREMARTPATSAPAGIE